MRRSAHQKSRWIAAVIGSLAFAGVSVTTVASAADAVASPATAKAGTPPTTALSSPATAEQPRHLLLRHASFNIGKDGVERETRYASRMIRTRDSIWVERVLPAALLDSTGHGHQHDAHAKSAGGHAGHSHAHDDAQSAPLLLQRDADGKIDVQSVMHDRRRIIHVDLAHHGNVGYGGSWAASWSLMDPRALQAMTKIGNVKNGAQRYERRQGEQTTQIDWDVAGQYARSISVRDAHGTSWRTLTATPQPVPAVMPWLKLTDYSHGDYSDLLD